MENQSYLEKLATLFGQSASVKNVFGEPIKSADKTIIPVAQIIFGLGGGQGKGKRKNKHNKKAGVAPGKDDGGVTGEESGGGGAMYVKAKGVYEITPDATRFIPANNTKQLLIALAVGFILRGWFFSKKKD